MGNTFARLFGRLRLWQKFALLGLLATLLAVLPFYLFVKAQQERIDTTRLEQESLKPAAKLLEIVQAAQKHRDQTAIILGGQAVAEGFGRRKQKNKIDEAVAAFDAMAQELHYPGLAEGWGRLKDDWAALARGLDAHTLDAAQSFEAHSKLIDETLALLQTTLAGSGLDLDANAASYYLIQAILADAPYLSERMAQARAFGSDILIKPEMARGLAGKGAADAPAQAEAGVTLRERVQLYNLTDRAKERLDDTKRKLGLFKLTAQQSKEALDGPVRQANASIENAIKLARAQIVDADKVSFPLNEFRTQFTEAIDAVFALVAPGVAVLNAEFDRQIRAARTAQYVTSAFLLGVFAIAALIAFYVSRSITQPVGHLVSVMDRLASGDSSVRANLQDFDEIGVLGHHFDAMVDQREAASEKVRQENEQLNNSVIALLQAVARLADKDLTAKVPVAEDITGLVADALNLLAQETATVLNRVVDIADKVAWVSRQVKSQADTVIGVAAEEKREVEQAAAELDAASAAMQDIAELALSCAQAAEQAIHNTDKAQATVLGTVEGITTIRDTIRETEKRIKRLGERSQEIGGVVKLINGIAESTHILAVNAAMHAASAGEAGRGFAVIANGVQKLAENAHEATLKIAGLVNNIQAETADTVTTMNDAISQVVLGTTLAQQAGSEMRQTRDTTAKLVQLVKRIADSSTAQAQTSLHLRERALLIQQSTEQTYRQSQEQGAQTERLVDFSGELVESVGVFNLPKAAGA